MNSKIKVLYIAGCGRTGSTILGNMLGQVEGFTHVGELLQLWANLAPGRPPCGCGVPIVACSMWKDVLKEAYGDIDESLISRMLQFRKLETHTRAFLRAATSRRMRMLQQRLAETLAELERLYRSIQHVFNCEVIVDSSKFPMYAYILQSIEAIDLYVLHLVRDPRAWAYAFFNKKVREGYILYMKPLDSSVMWNWRNCGVEAMSRRFKYRPLLVRYEDFVADPRGSLQSILNFVGQGSSVLPPQDEHCVNIETQHTVSGNPNRFMTGKIEIEDNHEWVTRMKRRHRMLVTAATWPLLTKYGYPIRTSDLRHKDMLQGGAKHLDAISGRNSKGDAGAEFAE